jgi:hypothetical protein
MGYGPIQIKKSVPSGVSVEPSNRSHPYPSSIDPPRAACYSTNRNLYHKFSFSAIEYVLGIGVCRVAELLEVPDAEWGIAREGRQARCMSTIPRFMVVAVAPSGRVQALRGRLRLRMWLRPLPALHRGVSAPYAAAMFGDQAFGRLVRLRAGGHAATQSSRSSRRRNTSNSSC